MDLKTLILFAIFMIACMAWGAYSGKKFGKKKNGKDKK